MANVITESATKGSSRTAPPAPGPSGLPVLGSVLDIRSKGLIQFYIDAWSEYGDIVRLQAGPMVQHLLARPEHIKYVLSDNKQNYEKGIGYRKMKLPLGQGLFTSEGEVWRRQRALMQPTFTPKGVTQFTGDMTETTGRMLRGWSKRTADGQALNINSEMMRLAMNIIGKTMFNIDIGRDALEAARAFTVVLEHISSHSLSMVDVPLFVPTRANRRFKKALGTLDSFIYGIIADRKRKGEESHDLFSILSRATDPETGEAMSERQLRDEIITIFFAGHETTAQALTWSWYLLANYPEVEEKLHEEVDRVLGGRTPTEAELQNLTYTSMVVDESMRLYPPVWVYVRDSIDEDEIGGYHIPPKSMIVLSQYITHRHPDLWDEPEKFDPERFTPERSKDRPRYAYFPFGGGPRVCLGNNFALLEAAIVIAMVSQQYRMRLVPGQQIRPRMVGTLRPDRPVRMTLEKR